MPRYFVRASFDGTDFHGWQIQPTAPTVQAEVEQALRTYFKEDVRVMGCGRTDTGVHASGMIFHFDLAEKLLQAPLRRLNQILPESIALLALAPVSDSAHARHDAFSRMYRYHVHFEKDPLRLRQSYYHPSPLDREILNPIAEVMLGEHDFSRLGRPYPHQSHGNCLVESAIWTHDADHSTFEIRANRFLGGMVRRVTGAMLAVARGKLSEQQWRDAVANQMDLPISPKAPAAGLILCDIRYPYPLEPLPNK